MASVRSPLAYPPVAKATISSERTTAAHISMIAPEAKDVAILFTFDLPADGDKICTRIALKSVASCPYGIIALNTLAVMRQPQRERRRVRIVRLGYAPDLAADASRHSGGAALTDAARAPAVTSSFSSLAEPRKFVSVFPMAY